MNTATRKPSLEGLKKAERTLNALYSKQASEELAATVSDSFGAQPDIFTRFFSKLKVFIVIFFK